jgi:hypothetical protein
MHSNELIVCLHALFVHFISKVLQFVSQDLHMKENKDKSLKPDAILRHHLSKTGFIRCLLMIFRALNRNYLYSWKELAAFYPFKYYLTSAKL